MAKALNQYNNKTSIKLTKKAKQKSIQILLG